LAQAPPRSVIKRPLANLDVHVCSSRCRPTLAKIRRRASQPFPDSAGHASGFSPLAAAPDCHGARAGPRRTEGPNGFQNRLSSMAEWPNPFAPPHSLRGDRRTWAPSRKRFRLVEGGSAAPRELECSASPRSRRLRGTHRSTTRDRHAAGPEYASVDPGTRIPACGTSDHSSSGGHVRQVGLSSNRLYAEGVGSLICSDR
jgi:hypothetical protein